MLSVKKIGTEQQIKIVTPGHNDLTLQSYSLFYTRSNMKYSRKAKRCVKGGRGKMGVGKAIQKSLRRLGKSGIAKKVSRKLGKKLLAKIDDL